MGTADESREKQRTRTIAAYQDDAAGYRAATYDMSDAVIGAIHRFADLCGAGSDVLEIGSGPGRDALALEACGLTVDRTDITSAFVDLLRDDGFHARVLDPLTGDLGGPFRGVWANAVLLHLNRDEVGSVLRRLAAATEVGGWLSASVKIGDDDAWVQRGTISGARHFTFWQPGPWCDVLAASGWSVVEASQQESQHGDVWLRTVAKQVSGPQFVARAR